MRQLLKNLRHSFTTSLDQSYFMKPQQAAVIFTATGKTWTYRNVIDNSKALAKGLRDQNFIQDDIVMIKLPIENIEENFVTRIALASIKAKVVVSKARKMEELEKQLHDSKARAFVFSSFDTLGDTTVIDTLYRLVPEMVHAPYDSGIRPSKFSFLRYLIQTDNYKYKGTLNYNRLMKFLLSTEYGFGFECKQELIKLPSKEVRTAERPIIITNPSEELAFRAGVLNSLTMNRFLICAKPNETKLISEQYDHEIDVICTEPMTELHQKNRIFLERGSKLYLKHPNRIQLALI